MNVISPPSCLSSLIAKNVRQDARVIFGGLKINCPKCPSKSMSVNDGLWRTLKKGSHKVGHFSSWGRSKTVNFLLNVCHCPSFCFTHRVGSIQNPQNQTFRGCFLPPGLTICFVHGHAHVQYTAGNCAKIVTQIEREGLGCFLSGLWMLFQGVLFGSFVPNDCQIDNGHFHSLTESSDLYLVQKSSLLKFSNLLIKK